MCVFWENNRHCGFWIYHPSVTEDQQSVVKEMSNY